MSDGAQRRTASRLSLTKKEELKFETGATPVLRSPGLRWHTLRLRGCCPSRSAGVQKIWHPDRIGFRAGTTIQLKIDELHEREELIPRAEAVEENSKRISVLRAELPRNETLLFNNYLDAVVAGTFLVLVSIVILLSVREWLLLLSRRKPAVLHEIEPHWLPDYAVSEAGGKFSGVAGTAALTLTLARELSGEAQLDRHTSGFFDADRTNTNQISGKPVHKARQQIYVEVTEKRFNGGEDAVKPTRLLILNP
jgi:hypothetical protein